MSKVPSRRNSVLGTTTALGLNYSIIAPSIKEYCQDREQLMTSYFITQFIRQSYLTLMMP